ncbi:MAG: hypothetical protein KAH38_13245 [Candidatus Hydrogenedentes bacterium]|nr:hypothetical protein [Candidatus Hydrogenedentota bacterium]
MTTTEYQGHCSTENCQNHTAHTPFVGAYCIYCTDAQKVPALLTCISEQQSDLLSLQRTLETAVTTIQQQTDALREEIHNAKKRCCG